MVYLFCALLAAISGAFNVENEQYGFAFISAFGVLLAFTLFLKDKTV